MLGECGLFIHRRVMELIPPGIITAEEAMLYGIVESLVPAASRGCVLPEEEVCGLLHVTPRKLTKMVGHLVELGVLVVNASDDGPLLDTFDRLYLKKKGGG